MPFYVQMYVSANVVLAEVLGFGVGIASMSTPLAKPGVSRALESDEFEEVFGEAAIGIELEDVSEASTAYAAGHPLLHLIVRPPIP